MISRFGGVFLVGALASSALAAEPRVPAAAGRFYPADPQELSAQVDGYLKAAGEPATRGKIIAILAPHAGLAYSGAIAAKAFAAASGLKPDVVVVLGTGHTKPLNGAALFAGAYATPEGAFAYDAALGADLMKRTKLVTADAGAHKKEHSIEMTLPFLRRVAPGAKLVALTLNTQNLEVSREIGRALAAALKGKNALIVVSADLSHYPPKDMAWAADGATLEAASALDAGRFWLANRLLLTRGIKELAVAWCGEAAMTVALEASGLLGARSLEVLARADSSQNGGDATRVVGYAAAAFTTAEPEKIEYSPAERAELLKLARDALDAWFKTGKRRFGALHRMARLNVPAAAFVTLRDAKGALRGCVGGLRAEAPLHEAVARAAVSAGVEDVRFPPVTAEELPNLSLDVSVLGPRYVSSAKAVKPGDGVILERDGKTGVFLPEVWREIPDKDDFLGELCSQKAGLEKKCWKDAKTKVFVFHTEAIHP